MNTFQKVIGCFIHPVRLFRYASRRGMLKWMHDETYIKIIYRLQVKKKLNLERPTTFNEKLQWLKLNERTAKYTIMVDKIAAKEYVAKCIGEEYVIPTIGMWEKAEDIDFQKLPEKFVLKCNHDSSSIVFCKDKRKLDNQKTRKELNYCLRNNGYWYGREWPYKNVKPCIFAEKLMENSGSRKDESLLVYKFLCFNGEPKIIQTIQNDKKENESIDYFDCDWNLLDMRQNFPNSSRPLERPKALNEMIIIASKLSKGLPFIRVDLYEIDGKVFFSEFTFFSDDGMNRFYPDYWDALLGEWIKLEGIDD